MSVGRLTWQALTIAAFGLHGVGWAVSTDTALGALSTFSVRSEYDQGPMCGRYLVKEPDDSWSDLRLIARFDFPSRYNIAPTQLAPVVFDGEARLFQWGLVPYWSSGRSGVGRMINARSETVDEKPSFREPFAQRRCLVPASGFYEWIGKKPQHIHRADNALLTFAGLWDRYADDEGELFTFAILTTQASDTLRPVHERQPVIVEPDDRERWLDKSIRSREQLRDIMAPGREHGLAFHEVSPLVNSVANDSPDCLRPGPDQQSLF